MSLEWTESLVAERVAQLDAIRQRRNVLLREMYCMIQQKHNVGVLLALDEAAHGNDDECGELKQFMDRFDLSKNQESAMICNLSDSELSVPFPSEEVAEGLGDQAAPDLDSPMSEPPASPTRIKSPAQKEEAEEAEINDAVNATAEVEFSELRPSTPSFHRPGETQEREEEEEEEEEEQIHHPDHHTSVPPPSRPPSLPASISSHHGTAVSRHSSRLRSPPAPLPSPQSAGVQPVVEAVEMDTLELMEDIHEESPQLVLPSSSPVFAQTTVAHSQYDISVDVVAAAAPSPSPVLEIPPRPMVIHTAVDVASIQPSLLIPTPTSPAPPLPDFMFEATDGEILEEPLQAAVSTETQHHHFNPNYNLPPFKALPAECLRKGKSSKQKKKDKDKADTKGGKEEWTPLGFAKWGAIIRANPIYKKVSRASKCLSTKDWSVAITELRLMRTLERVESLENVAKWSYRQPKKQRNLGGMTKTHWDYLLDEMKWMRVDFREERKWKYVLAFNISTTVLEWHAAGTHGERVKLGICMHWKPPRTTDSTSSLSQQKRQQNMEVDNEGVTGEQCDKEHAYSDQDSGDDDDEGEAEQRDIVDALETRNILEEALEGSTSGSGSGESGESSQRQSMGPDGVLRPKVEDVEDSSALRNASGAWQRDVDAMDVDHVHPGGVEGDKPTDVDVGRTQTAKTEAIDLAGLKPDSNDPVLGSQPSSESQSHTLPVPSPSRSAPKSNLYAPLREQIAYSDDSKLFVDNDDLDLVKALSDLTTEDSSPPVLGLESARFLDLSDLFPDLQVLGMPDVASSEPKKRSDKKSERDDNRRVDDAGYTKIAPMGKFMLCKPTLLSPLQPVRRWKNGKWLPPEEPAVTEAESLSSKITDEQLSELFDVMKPQTIGGTIVPHPPKDNKKRLDHAWSPAEDALLKSFVEKYPSNWTLVADSFNSARVTISIDKRTPWECFERWNLKLGGKPSSVPGHADVTSPAGVDGTPPPATPSTSSQQVQMTTRGVKRLANINIAQSQIGGASTTGVTVSSDTIKRRRHSLMYETIRKTAKKREAAQKATSMNQRKPPNIHDTHGQYNKMQKLTPAELSRKKAERDQQELMMARRRHDDLTRQQMLRAQQTPVAAAASAQPQQQPQPQQAQQQQQQQQQTGNGTARPATQPTQPAPPMRAQSAVPQVNISQQQRMPTPISAAAPAARMSPQQILQVQAAQARANAITAVAQSQAQVHAQLQAQAQVQVQAQGTPQAALSSLPVGAHLSPPYHSRAATSSPGIGVAQQASPPRTAVTPSNAGVVASPRPPSAQPQPPVLSPQIPGNSMPRSTSTIAAHYLPVVPPSTHFTQEQMDQALRLMQRTTMAQAQQGGQYPSQS